MPNVNAWPGYRGNTLASGFASYMITLGNKSHGGLIMGGGLAADPIVTAFPSQKMVEFGTKSTDTTASEGFYYRHYIAGAAQAGRAGMFWATVQGVVAGSAKAFHAVLDFSAYATSYIAAAGEGRALKATLNIPAGGAMPASSASYSAAQFEVVLGDNSSDPSGVTGPVAAAEFGLSGGNAAAQAKVPYVLSFVGWNVANGAIKTGTTPATPNKAMAVNVDGVKYYIPLYTTYT